MSDDLLIKIAKEIMISTTVDVIIFDIKEEPMTRYNSKIGGIPYLPPTFQYPTTNGNPLLFIAQINFQEFDSLENFPTNGILQFYVENECYFGCDYDNYTNKDGFKVVYFEDIEYDESKLLEVPQIEIESTPLESECKLVGRKGEGCMDIEDYRFGQLLNKYMTKYEIEGDEFEQKIRNIYSKFCISNQTTHLGGYACFAQYDIRNYNTELKEFSSTLFHIESEYGEKDTIIVWGDGGSCNFLIKPEDLKNKNFGETIFEWECH